jgi:hypothetical protein
VRRTCAGIVVDRVGALAATVRLVGTAACADLVGKFDQPVARVVDALAFRTPTPICAGVPPPWFPPLPIRESELPAQVFNGDEPGGRPVDDVMDVDQAVR